MQQMGDNQQHRDEKQRAGNPHNQQGRCNPAFCRSNNGRHRNRRIQQRVMHSSSLSAGDSSGVVRRCHVGAVRLQGFTNRNVLQGQRAGKAVLIVVGHRFFHVIASGFGIGAAHGQFKILRDLFFLGHTTLYRLGDTP